MIFLYLIICGLLIYVAFKLLSPISSNDKDITKDSNMKKSIDTRLTMFKIRKMKNGGKWSEILLNEAEELNKDLRTLRRKLIKIPKNNA